MAHHRAGRFLQAVEAGVGAMNANPDNDRARIWLWLSAERLGGYPESVPEQHRMQMKAGQAPTALRYEDIARKIGVEDMRRVDIVVCGSVAVNRRGTRLGKGAGYSDIEVALLQESGRIGPRSHQARGSSCTRSVTCNRRASPRTSRFTKGRATPS